MEFLTCLVTTDVIFITLSLLTSKRSSIIEGHSLRRLERTDRFLGPLIRHSDTCLRQEMRTVRFTVLRLN